MNHPAWTLVLIALYGCAPTVCDEAQAWAERCDVSWTDADTQTCRGHLKACTRAERDKLDAFWLCLDERKFFECPAEIGDTGSGGTAPPAGGEDLLACRDELAYVSIECSSAIGIDGGEFAGLTPAPETAP